MQICQKKITNSLNTTPTQLKGKIIDNICIVSIPFKPSFEEKLGDSKPMAVAQFHQLEKINSRLHKLA